MATAWYQVATVIFFTVICSISFICSLILVLWRQESVITRYNPLRSAGFTLLLMINVISLLYSMNLIPEVGESACSGWNVWAFDVMPRYVLMLILAFDFANLYVNKYHQQTFTVSFSIATTVACIVTFISMVFYDTVGAWPSAGAGCWAASGVELLIQSFSMLLTLLLLCAVVFPASRFIMETFRNETCSISGVPINRSMINWTGLEYVPTSFAEYDASVRYQQALRDDGRDASSTPSLLLSGIDGNPDSIELMTSHSPGQGGQQLSEMMDISWVIENASAKITPDLSATQMFEAILFDPRNRRHGLIETGLLVLTTVYLSHTGAWNFHPAWRVITALAYYVPFFYWQYFSLIRPAYFLMTRDETFIEGSRALDTVESIFVAQQTKMYTLEKMLDLFCNYCVTAEGTDTIRVQHFLRATCPATKRDRFCEFYLAFLILERRADASIHGRISKAEYIQNLALSPHSKMRLDYLNDSMMTVIQGSGHRLDSIDLFDSLLIAMLPVLEMRRDLAEIASSYKEKQQRLLDRQQRHAREQIDAARLQMETENTP